MFIRRAALAACLLPMLAGACSGGGGDEENAVTPVATRDQTASTPPPAISTPTVDIREIDVAALPDVQAAVAENGGTIVQTDVTYGDITADGIDDAIVPVASGGTLGFLGFFVITPEGATGKVLLQEFPADSAGLTIAVVGDKIEMTQPVPGPDDPECCPSFLRRTVFAWNGNALAVETVATDPNPGAAASPLPAATP